MPVFLKDFFDKTAEARARHRVVVPVASLRSEPIADLGVAMDPLQETQLLFGERVEVLQDRGDWSYIAAWEQPRYDKENKLWGPYYGWVTSCSLATCGGFQGVRSLISSLWEPVYQTRQGGEPPLHHLPLGAAVDVIDRDEKWGCIADPRGTTAWIRLAALQNELPTAEKMCRVAKKLVGMPYSWGGLCPWKIDSKIPRTSVDCSGLVHVAWRSLGVVFPRNAADQYRRVSSLGQGQRLQRGDLVFTSKEEGSEKISHVMILEDEQTLLESTDLFGGVCLSSLQGRLGHPYIEVTQHQQGAGKYLFFGRH